jgi:hypothetical protein
VLKPFQPDAQARLPLEVRLKPRTCAVVVAK